jgi:hypothetical protein
MPAQIAISRIFAIIASQVTSLLLIFLASPAHFHVKPAPGLIHFPIVNLVPTTTNYTIGMEHVAMKETVSFLARHVCVGPSSAAYA